MGQAFNLPDLQDKVPIGVSGTAVASTGGAATVASSGLLPCKLTQLVMLVYEIQHFTSNMVIQ